MVKNHHILNNSYFIFLKLLSLEIFSAEFHHIFLIVAGMVDLVDLLNLKSEQVIIVQVD